MLSRAFSRRFGALTYQIIKSTTSQTAKNAAPCVLVSPANVCKNRCCSQQASSSSGEMPTVDYDYVKKVASNNKVLIIDVREPDEVKEHGKIPNSVNIPLGTITATLSAPDTEFKETFKRDKPKENTEIIFYCMIGKRSGMAQKNAVNLGYKNAKNYLGSWTDWAAKSQ